MAISFPDQDASPYREVVLVAVTWSDGTSSRASGVFVGRNDILTAAHVVYSPARTVTDIDIYPAYDGAPGPYGSFTAGQWQTNFYKVGSAGTNLLTLADTAYDLALIGISVPLGATLGWMGVRSYAGAGTYEILGYPAVTGARLVSDTGFVPLANGIFDILSIYHAPGSSGGPLVDASGYVVGVVSTTSSANRIDTEWDTLQGWISANDVLLGRGFAGLNTTTGRPLDDTSHDYAGPVAGLMNEYITVTPDNVNISVGTANWFIHTGSGNDAVTVAGGTNVIDAGPGSNFLVGAGGADTFYVDDRFVTQDIWTTISSFGAGDAATLWGITQAGFRLDWANDEGATGYQGLTLHATAPGKPIASLTLAGYTTADLQNGRLTISFGFEPVSGSSYMFIARAA